MSSLHTNPALALRFLESIASLATKTASNICLPSTKAFWLYETSFPINTFTAELSRSTSSLSLSLCNEDGFVFALRFLRCSPLPRFSAVALVMKYETYDLTLPLADDFSQVNINNIEQKLKCITLSIYHNDWREDLRLRRIYLLLLCLSIFHLLQTSLFSLISLWRLILIWIEWSKSIPFYPEIF